MNLLPSSLRVLPALLAAALGTLPTLAQTRPFPTNATWDSYGVLPLDGSGKPFTLKTMNDKVLAYYRTWSNDFYRLYTTVDGQSVGVIEGPITGTLKDNSGIWKNAACISASEHTGYGMIIFALMAGCPGDGGEAKDKFDSLVRLYLGLKRPNNLMAWAIPKDTTIFKNALKPENLEDLPYSATDGDFDIAYALLLADAQWPKDTTHGKTYKQLAMDMIHKGIHDDLIFSDTKRIALGDWHAIGVRDGWADGSNVKDLLTFNPHVTRSSDFMFENLRAFHHVASASKRGIFQDAITECQRIFTAFNDQHNKKNGVSTGLVSDFIINDYDITSSNGTFKIQFKPGIVPAPQEVYDALEEDFPIQAYSENSCRVPQRLGLDYIHTRNAKSKAQLEFLGAFIRTIVQPGTSPLVQWQLGRDGYKLNGDFMDWGPNHLGNHHGLSALQFNACMVSTQTVNQGAALGQGATYLAKSHAMAGGVDDAYFKDTLTLKNLLAITGNWWSPVPRASHRVPAWTSGKQYQVGNLVRRSGNTWHCLSAHTSQASNAPKVPSPFWYQVR